MSNPLTNAGAEQSISAVVIRCGCDNPQGHEGQVCPQGRRINVGDLYYWHPNPIKRTLRRTAIKYRRWRLGI